MAQQNSMRNVQVEQFVAGIVYGTFESQTKEIYPRFITVMERLADNESLAMSFEDDYEMTKEYKDVSLNEEMVASIKRSRPIMSYNEEEAIISWLDPEVADLHQFKINPLALVQIEDLKGENYL